MNEEELCVDPTFKSDLPYTSLPNSKWVNNGQYMIVGDFPLQIDLELNLTCNYNCIMCMRDTIKSKIQYMKLDQALDIIDECGRNHMESIKLQYRGEPLLYPDIIKVIKRAKKNGIYVHFNTNGSLMTEEISKELICIGTDKVIISVESMFPKIYEQIRRGGKFGKVLNNINTLRFYRQVYNKKKPIIEIFATKQELNKKEIESEIFQTFWRIIADSITVAECFDLFDSKEDNTELPNWHCGQLWQRLIVLVDGDVLPCCAGIDYDNGIVYKIGNTNKETLKGIWNSEKLNKLRDLHACGESHKIEMCRKCRLRKSVIKKIKEE